jgi:DNA (cytosine-5)-methyltransferase 1
MSFKFIDLFAGIGSFHIGMHKNGGTCVFASELDKFSRKTYQHNFESISPELFTDGNFNSDITDPELDYNDIPDFDVMCAGFPCQPFSNAGHKLGFDDTRGTLFFNIQKIIEAKKPKVVILENVKGFVNHDKGNTFKVVKSVLDDLGYNVAHEILNSKHFGVPQNRERIFIIAWRKDLTDVTEFNFPFGIDGDNNVIYDKADIAGSSKGTRVGDILLDGETLKDLEVVAGRSYTITDKAWNSHQVRKQRHLDKGNGFGYSSVNADTEYTNTILARYYKDGSEILIEQAGDNPRRLHPIECARLQGFPIDDGYEIVVSDTQAYKQFGNSISVPVSSAIAFEVVKQLLS